MLEHVAIFPNSHYVVPPEKMERAIKDIEKELEEQVAYFKSEDKLIEAQRIAERTNFDGNAKRNRFLFRNRELFKTYGRFGAGSHTSYINGIFRR